MTTLALVGTGAWGNNYIRTISNLSSCQLPTNYIKTRDYQKLLVNSDIDGVIIATPSSTHYKIAKDFLEKGFNVLIEKPVTTTYSDALKLNEIAVRNNCVAMIGHIYLYNPAFVEMKKLMQKLGKIYYISCEGMDFGPFRADVSPLWDWAPHDIAMALYLQEEKPIAVSAWGVGRFLERKKNFDMCFLNLKFKNNIPVFIKVGSLAPYKKRNVTIMGEKHALVFDDTVEKKISLIENFGKNPQILYPSYSSDSPLVLEIDAFVESIRNKKSPQAGLRQGIEVVKIIEAAQRSVENKGQYTVL